MNIPVKIKDNNYSPKAFGTDGVIVGFVTFSDSGRVYAVVNNKKGQLCEFPIDLLEVLS